MHLDGLHAGVPCQAPAAVLLTVSSDVLLELLMPVHTRAMPPHNAPVLVPHNILLGAAVRRKGPPVEVEPQPELAAGAPAHRHGPLERCCCCCCRVAVPAILL